MLRRIGLWIGIYPIVAHLGLWASYPRLAVGYLVVLLLVVLLYPPRFLQIKNIVIASFIILSVMSLVIYGQEHMLVYLPPVLIPGMLFIVFMQSLKQDNTPFITQFAMKTEGNLDFDRKIYTRHVTELWAVVFAFMVVEAIALAVLAPIEVWSWFTHIGSYILIAFVLIVEFIYRQYHFKSSNNFKQFVIALVKYRWK